LLKQPDDDGPGQEGKSRFVYFVNTHLHSLMNDDYLRMTQVEMMLFWIDQMADFSKDLVIIVGDFNAKPDSETYRFMVKAGYTSSHFHVHG
jgi:endonuclease/exonuclease/phosphatase family metal-dependent hydrolase